MNRVVRQRGWSLSGVWLVLLLALSAILLGAVTERASAQTPVLQQLLGSSSGGDEPEGASAAQSSPA
ncbi:MAG: hypothetical protein AAGE83_16240, partial [Pseudomonadota bacterium]